MVIKPGSHLNDLSPPGIIMESNMLDQETQIAQKLAEFRNEAKRHAERMGEYKDWVKPENIAVRLKEHEETSAAAIEIGKKLSQEIRQSLGMPLEDPPLPHDLPKHMQGQAESTIRAFLRHEEWQYDGKLKTWKKKGR